MSSKSEVIVSSDDTRISMGGGVSKAILDAGGEIIQKDAWKKLPAQIGDVIVSTAGNLEYQKFIFHCLTIDNNKKEYFKELVEREEDIQNYILQHSVDKCFRLAQALEISSMAFPCIGAGMAQISITKVAEVMADAISQNLCRTQKPYQIEFYLYDQFKVMKEIDYIDVFEKFAIKSALAKYKSELEIKQVNTSPQKSTFVQVPKREEMKHLVFISYSRKDAESVEYIKSILEDSKIPYWIDKEGIFSGENYKEVIVDAIDVSKVVIFVSSANSNSSINVVRELGYAVQQHKTIIPILVDDSQYAKSIRLDIADIDQIEFSDLESTRKKLVASLAYSL